jgi:hypothetical protein
MYWCMVSPRGHKEIVPKGVSGLPLRFVSKLDVSGAAGAIVDSKIRRAHHGS